MTTADAASLLPPDLMAQLERLELVTRKVFRGRMKGGCGRLTSAVFHLATE